MSGDPRFWLALRNTLLLVVVLIPLQFALALSMALLLRERLRFSGVYFYLWAVLLAVVVAELWRATSLVLIIIVAGMQLIPRDYDEAAQVFGATFWQRLRHVTLPLLKPSLQVALILRTILAFEAFAVAQALTGRNFPLLVGETYEWYVNLADPGVASAVALVVLAVSIVTAFAYLRLLRQPGTRGR